MSLLFALACASSGWTEPGAVEPTLERLDADHDGEVNADEYQARLFHGAPFEQVDTDHDGELSAEELLQSMLTSDPSSLTVPRTGPQVVRAKKGKDKERKGGAPGKIEDQPADARRVRSESQWVIRMTLLALKEEVRSVNPNAATPTDDEIKVAAASNDLRTVETRAVLAKLEAASDAAGIDFPARLRAAALAKEPVVPTEAPPEEPEGAGPGGPDGQGGPGGPGGPGPGPGRNGPGAPHPPGPGGPAGPGGVSPRTPGGSP